VSHPPPRRGGTRHPGERRHEQTGQHAASPRTVPCPAGQGQRMDGRPATEMLTRRTSAVVGGSCFRNAVLLSRDTLVGTWPGELEPVRSAPLRPCPVGLAGQGLSDGGVDPGPVGRCDTGGFPGVCPRHCPCVIQQRSGPVSGTDHGDGLSVSDPGDRFERAAEANAVRALSGPVPEAAVQRPPPTPRPQRRSCRCSGRSPALRTSHTAG
jgi:hypothetical protein